MRTVGPQIHLAVAAASLWVLPSCALKVKVREDWEPSHRKPIPLAEATRTWNTLKRGEMPPDRALDDYNRAIRGSVVQIAHNWAEGGERGSLVRTTEGEVGLRVNPGTVPGLARAEEVVPADFIKVRRGFRERNEVEGVGTPLIVRQPRSGDDPMIPDSGLWVPVTALLNLDQPGSPVLELFDPTAQRSVGLGGTSFPLSANYTAAFARDFQDRQFQFRAVGALLRFEDYADRIGLYRVTPFHPGKEPCILIHGINSSPATWDVVLNRLYADEAIRERYEFWTFGYPTGAPIPYMAAEFRQAIHEMIAFRRARAGATPRITIVGHSMGGLLAKAMTFSSGDAEWDRLFKVPVDQLDLPADERDILRRMIYFEPIPEIRRVVFCAVPHRGSHLAENPAMKLVGDVIQVPTQLLRLSTAILTQSAYALTPVGLEFTRDRLTSLDQLSSDAWTTAEFLNKPLSPQVTYHSLIGNCRLDHAPPEKGGDGVVPYRSAHIEGVASELVVSPSGHSVHRTKKGSAEIARILRLP